MAILAREINASAPVSPRSSPSRPSSAFQSGQDEFAAGNIAILECAGDVAADHETLVAERPPPMLAVKHMATSPALNSGGRIHFVRSDEKVFHLHPARSITAKRSRTELSPQILCHAVQLVVRGRWAHH